MSSVEDLGYQSSVSSPDQTKRGGNNEAAEDTAAAAARLPHKQDKNLLRIEKGVDAFSQSLPETFLKAVKVDLSSSVNAVAPRDTNNKSRVVYDPRIFGSGRHATDGETRREGGEDGEGGGAEDPVEKAYFEKMTRMHSQERTTYKGFLGDSFKDGSLGSHAQVQQTLSLHMQTLSLYVHTLSFHLPTLSLDVSKLSFRVPILSLLTCNSYLSCAIVIS